MSLINAPLVVLFFQCGKRQRPPADCTMFQVLLVVPRFLLLQLKFSLHDRVGQHPAGSSVTHTAPTNISCIFLPSPDGTPKPNGVRPASQSSSDSFIHASSRHRCVCAHSRTNTRTLLTVRSCCCCCCSGRCACRPLPLLVFKIKLQLVRSAGGVAPNQHSPC